MTSPRPLTPYPVFRRKDASSPNKKNDITEYCREMLQKSMLTGVPQIVSAPTTRSKVFKTFVLLVSVTGFLYQTSKFLVTYFSYPTLVDVQLTTPPFVDVPAITICNRNGLRRLEYCRMKPENCEHLSDTGTFCESYPESCEKGLIKGGNMYPKIEFMAEEASATQEVLKEAGHPPFPLVTSCHFGDVNVSFDFCNASTFEPFIFQDLYGKMKQCYILNAMWTKETLNLPKVPARTVLKMILDLEPDQYFRIDRKVSGQLSIHSPWSIHNPFLEGLTIKPRRMYLIRIKEDIKNLLPWPYQTNCTDYIHKWRTRGNNGPLSKEMCIEECILNQTLDNCQCALTNNLYPHKYKFCDENTDSCTDQVNYTSCFVKCSAACHSRTFSAQIQEEDALLGADEISAQSQNWNRTVILLFIFKSTEVNIYRYRAKYETFEFYSFMGGFMGIWLGVSLIAIFDFLESLATFAVFLCDRFKGSNQVRELKSAVGSRLRSNSIFSTDSMPWAKNNHQDTVQHVNNLVVNNVRRMPRTP